MHKAFYELQLNSDKLKSALKEVQVANAAVCQLMLRADWRAHMRAMQEFSLGDGKSAIAVFVPFPQYSHYQKLIKEKGLIEELEKKFSGKNVVILAQVCAFSSITPNP